MYRFDGAKDHADASKSNAVSYQRLLEIEKTLQAEVEELFALRERKEKAAGSGRKPGGRTPQPPTEGPHDKHHYNVTDPGSRVMKNSTNQGFDEDYNAQVSVDQESFLLETASAL